MAHTDDIRPETLNEVVRQITALVERGLAKELLVEEVPGGGQDISGDVANDLTFEHPLSLADSIRIYQLGAEALKAVRSGSARGDLGEWVSPSDEVHHQIFLRGEAIAFARFLVPASGEGEVLMNQLNVSPLAAQIEDALKTIKDNQGQDEVLAADPVVRLLDMPSYHMLALWVYAESLRRSRVLIVSASEFDSETWAGHVLTTEQFFQRLRDIRPLAGTT